VRTLAWHGSNRREGAHNNGMKLTARGASVEARQLIPVFYGHQGRERRVRIGANGCFALAVVCASCTVPPEDIVTNWPEGLVAEHRDLKCNWYDGDSSAVSYSYTTPANTSAAAVIKQLRIQIERSGGRRGAPQETCFEVVNQSPGHLVVSCANPSSGVARAWEVRVAGNVATVVTGPPPVVLQHLAANGPLSAQ
jgi:hypothetical protein